jgi:glutaredoxin 3
MQFMAVTIYTTPSCGYCVKAKEYFRNHKINFVEHNVASNMQKADEMVKKSGQMGVPVIDINGRIIIGFNQPEIERALHR